MAVSIRMKAPYLTEISVRSGVGNRSLGIISAAGRQFSCALGRSGITVHKREGDGATPAGKFNFVSAYYRPDREIRRASGLKITAICNNMGWCDAPGDRNYNKAVTLPYQASHEKLWRDDRLYNWCVVLDQNYSIRMRGLGSAIFFHIAAPGFTPTEGCVAICPEAMRWLIMRIDTRTRLVVEAG